jgi:hypothetical protein
MHNSNWNRRKGTDLLTETATKPAPKPGNYPIGSVHSRAAARALVQEKEKSGCFIQIVGVSPDGTRKNGPLIQIGRKKND